MTPMQALIEAAVRHLSNCRCGGTGLYSRNPYLVEPFDCDKCSELRAAISSAKAAEEGVETKWVAEDQEKPAHHNMVLVWREGKDGSASGVGMAFWAKAEGYGWTKGDGNFANDIWATITHWRPLPEPPTVIEVREKEGL